MSTAHTMTRLSEKQTHSWEKYVTTSRFVPVHRTTFRGLVDTHVRRPRVRRVTSSHTTKCNTTYWYYIFPSKEWYFRLTSARHITMIWICKWLRVNEALFGGKRQARLTNELPALSVQVRSCNTDNTINDFDIIDFIVT